MTWELLGKKEKTYCVLKGRVRYMDREEDGHRTCCKKGLAHSSRIGMNLLDYCRLASYVVVDP